MKTVSGKVTLTKPVSLAKASFSTFVTVDNGASPAISIYLRKASEAFDELHQFHKGLRNPKSERKSRKAPSLADSVSSPPLEFGIEDAEINRKKHSKKNVGEGNNDNGLMEASEVSRRSIEQEMANGDGKFVGSEGEKSKRKNKDKKLKEEAVNVIENGAVKGKRGNINEAEEEHVKKKKKEKEKEKERKKDGNVEEDRDRGKKRKIEATGDGREEDGSTEQKSKKKKRRRSTEED